MSNSVIGIAVYSLKIRLNEILLRKLFLNELLLKFSEYRDYENEYTLNIDHNLY